MVHLVVRQIFSSNGINIQMQAAAASTLSRGILITLLSREEHLYVLLSELLTRTN